MSWEFHPAQAVFAQYRGDWDRLNDQLYDSHPYFDSRFVGPLLKYFGTGREHLCLYRVQGVVHAALILQSRGGGRWVSFRPEQAQITPLLIADARLLNELLLALPGFVWSIEFYAVDLRYAPMFSCLSDQTIASNHACTIGISPGLAFEEYWQQRPKNLRSNVRRYTNRLEREAGGAEYTCLVVPEAMHNGVRRFGELESTGWKGASGTAVSMDNNQGQFYDEVLAGFAGSGQAAVCELAIAGELAASRLLIGNARMRVILKTSYNEALARFAPCRQLLYYLLKQELTKYPERTIEFYTNATRDQSEWSTFRSSIQNIQLFRNDGAIVAYLLFKILHRGLVCTLPQHPESAEPRPFVVRSCASLEALAAEAESLDGFAPSASIEDSLDWFGLLQRQVYPADPGIRYYYIAEQGPPTAILPLRKTLQRGVRTLESLSNYYTSLYTPLLGSTSTQPVLQHLLAAATREDGGAHVMRFAPMDPGSPGYATLLNDLRATGWIPLSFFCFGNWFLPVDGSWDSYLRKRSANLRSNIKRRNREFVAEGGMLEVVSEQDNLEEAIAAFQEVYSASWKKPEPYPEFVPSLIRMLAPLGMLRLGIAKLKGQPIAAQLWIVGKGKASIYKVAYHNAYAALSPGTVLTSFLLRHVIEQDRVGEVDFLIGDDDYKKIWMSDRRERWGIVAFNPRTVVGCALLLKEVVGRMVKTFGRRLSTKLANSRSTLLTAIRSQVAIGKNKTYLLNNQQKKL